MELIDRLNPFKHPWWLQDEWHRIGGTAVHRVTEEHDSSWDVCAGMVGTYKNKETGETRRRYEGDRPWSEDTTFTDPTTGTMTWHNGFIFEHETEYIEDKELYEGGDYE